MASVGKTVGEKKANSGRTRKSQTTPPPLFHVYFREGLVID